jgi:hypothetical protein
VVPWRPRTGPDQGGCARLGCSGRRDRRSVAERRRDGWPLEGPAHRASRNRVVLAEPEQLDASACIADEQRARWRREPICEMFLAVWQAST